MKPAGPRNVFQRYSFFWMTLVLFLGSLAGHWVFSWFAYVDEQLLWGERLR